MKNFTRKLALSLLLLSSVTVIHAGDIGNPTIIAPPPPPPTRSIGAGTTATSTGQIRVTDSEFLAQLLPTLTQALVALF